MYENILLAVDGSEQSKAAARAAADFIKLGVVKKIIILNSANYFVGSYEMIPMRYEELNMIAKELGQKIVAEISEMLDDTVEIEEKVIFGDAALTICETAKDNNSDLIIMGSRGMNQVKGLFLGSVSTRVLQFAPCPVLIVKK